MNRTVVARWLALGCLAVGWGPAAEGSKGEGMAGEGGFENVDALDFDMILSSEQTNGNAQPDMESEILQLRYVPGVYPLSNANFTKHLFGLDTTTAELYAGDFDLNSDQQPADTSHLGARDRGRAVVVLFHGDHRVCDDCEQTEEDFGRVVKNFSASPRQGAVKGTVDFATVDCGADVEVADAFDITFLPAVKIFFGTHDIVDYRGLLEPESLVEWIQKIVYQPFEIVRSTQELAKVVGTNAISAVGFFEHIDEGLDEFDNFVALARRFGVSKSASPFTPVVFALTTEKSVIEKLEIEDELLPTLWIIRPFDDPIVEFEGTLFDLPSAIQFVKQSLSPVVTRLTDENLDAIMGGDGFVALLIADRVPEPRHRDSHDFENRDPPSGVELSNWVAEDIVEEPDPSIPGSELSSQIKLAFLQAAREFSALQVVQFVVAGAETSVEHELLEHLGGILPSESSTLANAEAGGQKSTGGDVPSLWFLELSQSVIARKYKYDIPIKRGDAGEVQVQAEDVANFIDAAVEGSLPVYLKSQPIVLDQTGPIVELVAYNFREVVLETDKNVFVLFYAPWCGHCRRVDPMFREAAERFVAKGDLVFARLDATANDVPLELEGYPSMIFFPAKDKFRPIMYDGAQTIDSMLQFLYIVSAAENLEKSHHDEL